MERKNVIITARRDTSNVSMRNHYHNAHEMIFVCSGEIEITVNRTVYTAKRGSLIFISNHEHHSVRVVSEPYERFFIIIDPMAADRIINNPILMSILKNRPGNFAHCVDVSGNMNEFLSLFERICGESGDNDPLSDELVGCFLKEMLIMVLRGDKEAFPVVRDTVKNEIYEIQRYIDHHFEENILISELAGKYYISVYHLSRSFKKQTGYGPKRYLTMARLSHARELLVITDCAVGDIADKCRFNDVNNFIRVFRREFGITPGQYRVAFACERRS